MIVASVERHFPMIEATFPRCLPEISIVTEFRQLEASDTTSRYHATAG